MASVESMDIFTLTETCLDMSRKVFHPKFQKDRYTFSYKNGDERRRFTGDKRISDVGIVFSQAPDLGVYF